MNPVINPIPGLSKNWPWWVKYLCSQLLGAAWQTRVWTMLVSFASTWLTSGGEATEAALSSYLQTHATQLIDVLDAHNVWVSAVFGSVEPYIMSMISSSMTSLLAAAQHEVEAAQAGEGQNGTVSTESPNPEPDEAGT